LAIARRLFQDGRAMKSFPRLAIALFVCALIASSASAQKVQCNPCQNAFGRIQLGTSSTFGFKLTNVGTKTLQIASISVSNKAFSIGTFRLPAKLSPGASVQLPAIFTPTNLQRVTGKIVVSSNAQDPTLVLRVAGKGVDNNTGTTLGVSPTSLNFGNVKLGASGSLPLTLTASNGSVTVSGILSASSEFTTPGLAFPFTINQGQKVAVTVVFTPNASGTASANLVIKSNASNSPNTVAMTGTGVASGSHSADLTWDPSGNSVIGYNVYRGNRHGGPYSQINTALDSSTNFTDGTVQGGATYFYVVTAVNSDNQESGFSNEVKAVIPN
jgi:hypothetical protein